MATRISLSPDMEQRFEAIAARFGMPPETIGAYAIANFVLWEEAKINRQQRAMSWRSSSTPGMGTSSAVPSV